MNRYKVIAEDYKRVQQQLLELKLEYEHKIKGDVYTKRRMQLINKLDDLKKKAKQIGVVGTICHVQGKRSRPHRRNLQIMVTENFNPYFINTSEEEISSLVHLHIKNVIQYTIKFIKPGMLMTS